MLRRGMFSCVPHGRFHALRRGTRAHSSRSWRNNVPVSSIERGPVARAANLVHSTKRKPQLPGKAPPMNQMPGPLRSPAPQLSQGHPRGPVGSNHPAQAIPEGAARPAGALPHSGRKRPSGGTLRVCPCARALRGKNRFPRGWPSSLGPPAVGLAGDRPPSVAAAAPVLRHGGPVPSSAARGPPPRALSPSPSLGRRGRAGSASGRPGLLGSPGGSPRRVNAPGGLSLAAP